ncbi:MAG: CvpA family protein [Candidatus Brocadiia bacterium]
MTFAAMAAISVSWLYFTDVVLVVIVVLSAYFGFRSGFAWQIVRIVAWVGAYWVAVRYHADFAGKIGNFWSDPAREILCFGIIFGGILIGTSIVEYLGGFTIDALRVATPDRITGAMLGVVKGVIVCGILGALLHNTMPEGSFLLRETKKAPVFSRATGGAEILWEKRDDLPRAEGEVAVPEETDPPPPPPSNVVP